MLLGYLIFLILVKRFDVKLVNLRSMLTNEILDQLMETFKEWRIVFKAYPIQEGV